MSDGFFSAPSTMGKPPGGYAARDTQRRLDWLKNHTGRDLDELPLPVPEDLQGIVENHVGFVPLPLAVASPMVVHGTYARGEFAVPLCTVEGTLALSMTRGMLAMAMSGGVKAVHTRQELSRSPFFIMPNVHEIPHFIDWVRRHHEPIRVAAEATTRHGRLLRIDPLPVNNWVILDFVYDTGNAAGQNMVTLATEAACQYIRRETGRRYYIESGYNGDKKASRRSLSSGRGHSVIVEVNVPERVLEFLGVTQQAVLEWQAMAFTSGQSVGTLGNTLHLSNALTALYLATGQDTACVAENSVGYTQAFPSEKNGLLCHMTLPSLTIGTVGGGTRLPAQRRNLELLGCHEGPHSARKLAEIIGACAASLELSLLTALVSGTFAQAHQKYGRKAS